MEKSKVLEAILEMAKDDNKGLMMSDTVVSASEHPKGGIISFGVPKAIMEDAKLVNPFFTTAYLHVSFAIDRKELKAYLAKQSNG